MSKAIIENLRARQIFDSRGRPTVEVDVYLSGGSTGRASVPAGASTGTFEARERRDRDPNLFEGLSVGQAIENVNGELADKLKGRNAFEQKEIDELLVETDGTENLNRLGANAVLGVSIAVCRAAANFLEMPLYGWIAELSETEEIRLPVPMVNILSGGLHAGRAMDVQDFLFIPAGADSIGGAIRDIAAVRSAADNLALEKGFSTLLADEGGLSPAFETSREALAFLTEVFERAGLAPFEDALIGVDVAASTLQTEAGDYRFARENRTRSSTEMMTMVEDWAQAFPLASVEDPLGEEDWTHWEILQQRLGSRLQIVGDDLLATNLRRLQKGVDRRAAGAVLVKLNQNGTLTGTLEVVRAARENGWATIVSARSGETEDAFIADLAVGAAAGQIKIGSFRNSERLSKYNQLLRIEEETAAPYAGRRALAGKF